MSIWRVQTKADDTRLGVLEGPGIDVPVIMGKGGVRDVAAKQEGDGATPLGTFPFRNVFYRPDRAEEPITGLPTHALSPDLGWCDAPDDAAYNRLIRLPYGPSHEKLWREDSVYDLLITIGHNDDPVVPGLGSAIFVHLQRPDARPTEGCIALQPADMRRFLRLLAPGDQLIIERG